MILQSRRPMRLAAVFCLLVAAACGGDSGTEPGAATSVVKAINELGGTVTTPNGAVRLVFPAGAVPATTTITVAATTTHPASPRLAPGTVYEFGPDGTQFAEPVALTIAYDPAQLPQGTAESSLALHKAVGSGWQPVAGSTVDAASDRVTAPISSFSTYGILSLGAPGTVTALESVAAEGVVGTSVTPAPAVLVRSTSGQPLPGVAVTFAATAGGGTVTGGTVTTDASGVARVGGWQLGAAGPNTLQASVAGLAPVTFTTTAFAACDFAPAYTLGTTVQGQLANGDCVDAGGRRADYRRFEVAANTSLLLELTSSAFSPLVTVMNAQGVTVITQYTSTPGITRAVLAPGSYRLVARAVDTAGVGAYSLTARQASHDVNGCGPAFNVFITPGASDAGSITAGDCADQFDARGIDRVDTYTAWLRAGQSYRAQLVGAPEAKLSLWGPNASGSENKELIGVPGTPGTVTFTHTATQDGWHTFYPLGPVGTTYQFSLAEAAPVDPCAVYNPLAVGRWGLGLFSKSDCRDAQNRKIDRWSFTTAGQLSAVVRLGSSTTPFVGVENANKLFIVTQYTSSPGVTRAILEPGTYGVLARAQDTSAVSVYTLSVTPETFPDGCGGEFNVFVSGNVNASGQITSADCADTYALATPGHRWDAYSVRLDPGATATVTMRASQSGTLSVWGPGGSGGNGFIRAVNTDGSNTATITHNSTAAGFYTFYALSFAGTTYQLTFTTTRPSTAALQSDGASAGLTEIRRAAPRR